MGRPRRPAGRGVRRARPRPDGKVASYLYNSIEYLEGVFATWKCGAAPVNVNYRYLEDELRYLLENSDTEILLFHGVLGEQVAKVWRDVPTLKAIVQVDDGHPLVEGALRYEDLIAAHEPAPRTELSGDDLYILYTGGTTGMPKGVMWRNEDLYESLVPVGPRPVRRRAARGARPTSAASRPRSRPRAGRRSTSPRRRSCTAPAS